MNPLVIGYHLVWTAYGWWLPNDPRGSGSRTLRNDTLAELGTLHFGRKKAQPAGRIVRQFYEQAATRLKHDLLSFDESEFAVVAEGFGEVIATQQYTCYACAIMPDHVHILIRKHRHLAEEMIQALIAGSREKLLATGYREPHHPVWTWGNGWKVFLEHPDEVRRTIGYIDRNPLPLGLPRQTWPFVTDYDNWPLHAGHSPNSPYAKQLRAAGRYP